MGDLGDPYAELDELQTRLGGTNNSDDDAAMNSALRVVSRGLEKVCHRQFNKATSATARIYGTDSVGTSVLSKSVAIVDDFHTTTGLAIATDTSDDGSFGSAWSATDYQLEPLSGIVDGETGWPYWLIRAVGSNSFPMSLRRAPLQVTAQWGWAAVPAAVKEACLVVAEETFKLKDAPFGVANLGEWGVARVKANPMAMAMIHPYRRDATLVM
jgi:hypothetical protein